MGALDDGTLGTELVTDLGELADDRRAYFAAYGVVMPLQDAEREAGLTDADIKAQIRGAT